MGGGFSCQKKLVICFPIVYKKNFVCKSFKNLEIMKKYSNGTKKLIKSSISLYLEYIFYKKYEVLVPRHSSE
jgi:hypothetical protein